MRTLIVKQFDFHASHVLPNHSGQCRRLHGHSYQLEVCVEGPVCEPDGSSSEGMILDFGELKTIYKKRIEPHVEHQHLNDTLPVAVPTAENIARWALTEFSAAIAAISGGSWVAAVKWVRVWETATSYAEARNE